MRRVVYWQKADRLVYLDEKATPEFWDRRWQTEGTPPAVSPRDDVVTVTTKYLATGSRVLEGGCGRANKVKAMTDAGFDAIGIDFAEESVKRARLDYPGLDIRQGDVRSLDFADRYFDGYWSIDVIEHFWTGYDAILAEAGLSFLGLGVKASTPTWGLIVADSRSFFSRAWWLGIFPGMAIMITVLSINFFGDALRDILDVRN